MVIDFSIVTADRDIFNVYLLQTSSLSHLQLSFYITEDEAV